MNKNVNSILLGILTLVVIIFMSDYLSLRKAVDFQRDLNSQQERKLRRFNFQDGIHVSGLPAKDVFKIYVWIKPEGGEVEKYVVFQQLGYSSQMADRSYDFKTARDLDGVFYYDVIHSWRDTGNGSENSSSQFNHMRPLFSGELSSVPEYLKTHIYHAVCSSQKLNAYGDKQIGTFGIEEGEFTYGLGVEKRF